VTTAGRAPLRWFTVRAAAEILALTCEALRKQLERNARRAPDGGIEAELDGVRGRKFGRLWRVSFGDRWTVE
jgi:hypothetical protein